MPGIASNSSSYLDQLDDFSLLNVFDFVFIDDLITLAETSPRFADIIVKHYIVGELRLHEKAIKIAVGYKYPSFTYADLTNQKIIIDTTDPNKILRVIQHFGYVFSHVTFAVSDFGNAETEEFFKHVDKYCKTATKEIKIDSVDYEAIANWTYSFDHTTTKILRTGLPSNSIPFSQLFPYMQELSVGHLFEADVQHYPHLTKCSIRSTNSDERDPCVHEFIRLNPQIRHFFTTMTKNASYIEYLSETLPNLEWLGIQMVISSAADSNLNVIRFKRVREFQIILIHYNEEFGQIISNLHFDQLEALTLNVVQGVFAANRFMGFIARNRGLKTIETNVPMTHELFNGLLQQLPELEMISFNWFHGMLDTLEAFFMWNRGLSKINIHGCYEIRLRDFEQIIQDSNWKVVAISMERPSFSFVRMY